MVWGDGAPLCFTLDHADLWDLRCDESFLDDPRYTYAGLRRLIAEGKFDEAKEVFEEREKRDNPVLPGKISLGRAELRLSSPTEYHATLDLSTATVTGNGWQAFVHKSSNVLCIRTGGEELNMIPLTEMTPELAPPGLCRSGRYSRRRPSHNGASRYPRTPPSRWPGIPPELNSSSLWCSEMTLNRHQTMPRRGSNEH